jgi:hypothetical protein
VFLVSAEFQESLCENYACPDRMSANPDSPDFDLDVLRRGIRVWIDGKEHKNVYAYCVSEGVVDLAIRRTRTRSGRVMTLKKRGEVRPMYRGVRAALDRIEAGDFRDDLMVWLAEREIPEYVKVRNPALG